MAKVNLSKEELEIIVDYLPASYKEETPRKVTDLKLKLIQIKKKVALLEALEA